MVILFPFTPLPGSEIDFLIRLPNGNGRELISLPHDDYLKSILRSVTYSMAILVRETFLISLHMAISHTSFHVRAVQFQIPYVCQYLSCLCLADI